jgi:hypothetical protein
MKTLAGSTGFAGQDIYYRTTGTGQSWSHHYTIRWPVAWQNRPPFKEPVVFVRTPSTGCKAERIAFIYPAAFATG